ncbi:MAG: sulfatase-like hydrolase/transferase [Leptospiraceae bacterium]|nr:sulfatase-like hydrolase/transferase [Leptospiraceae bacterium]
MHKLNLRSKVFLFYFFIFLISCFFYRTLFFFIYRDYVGEASVWSILKGFFVGVRFDLSVIVSILSPFYLLSLIFPLNRYSGYRFVWAFLPNIFYMWMVSHLAGDIIYFANANKHLGYEGFVFLNRDIFVLIQSFFFEKPILLISVVFFILFYLTLATYIYRKKFLYVENQRKPLNRLIEFIVFTIFSVITIRGGLQNTSLRPSHAIISNNGFINILGLNGVFTSFYDLSQTQIPENKKIPLAEAILHVRESIQYEGAEFENLTFPILRKVTAVNDKKPPNIVIVLLESWTGKFVKPISKDGLIDGKEVTPNFNRLAEKGIFFKRFFATGGRTSNGLFATLTGIPDRPMMSVLHTQEANARVSGLGKLLKQLNFESLFMTGSNLSFENLEPHIKRWGFDKIVDEKIIEQTGKYKKGIWGYDDADGLELFNDYLKKQNPDKPFVATYLTISTHYPYKVPDKKFEIFDAKTNDFEFLNSYHYADYAIGKFIQEAEKEKYFENTIFVFLSDHTHHKDLNHYEDRNIPLLIYAPNRFKPEIKNTIGSQLDIIPTLLGIIAKPVLFSAMGKDLLSPKSQSFAYFCFGYLYGWIDDEHFYFQNIYGVNRTLNFTMKEPYRDIGDCEISLKCKVIERKTNAFLNLPIQLMEKNLVFPW